MIDMCMLTRLGDNKDAHLCLCVGIYLDLLCLFRTYRERVAWNFPGAHCTLYRLIICESDADVSFCGGEVVGRLMWLAWNRGMEA